MSTEGMVRIDPSSPVHQEVARLYRISQEQRPGGKDLWNGELYARSDDKWGGLGRDGTMRLNQDLVLQHLTGGSPSADPEAQAQALATVLHESRHARTEVDAAQEPNALRAPQSIGLDEGLTELSAAEDFADFTQRAGYDGVPQPDPEYAGAVHAAGELLERATDNETERAELLNRALDEPVVMRWDTIADSIVRNELGDTVPPDAAHQQAARAHLVNQMAVPEWAGVQNRPKAGPLVAADTNAALDRAVGQVQAHYQQNPGEPYPAKVPNPQAAISTDVANQPEQQRAVSSPTRPQTVDLTALPPPDATTRITTPQANGQAAGQATSQPAAAQPSGQADGQSRFLSGQAPAAQATRHAPSLGDGSRGASTRSTGQTHTRQTPQTTGRE